jgi:hypothetical protein
MYHFSMGAINKNTNNYEYPKIASKKCKYKCPDCEKDVIFKKGIILKPHFAHYKSEKPCYYYDKPSETQIHKDAKLLLKTLLDNNHEISFHRECCKCLFEEPSIFGYKISKNDYNENTKSIMEYKFNYNHSNRSADVALIENDEIKYIFEICYKNKTKEENRPEPWFEINAEDLINQMNSGEIIDEEGTITIQCIRDYKCEECIQYEEFENKKRELFYEKLKQEEIERKRKEIERKTQEIERKRQEIERKEQERKDQERKWRESLKQKEEEKIRKEEEEKLRQPCKCGIMIINICICETPKYELNRLSNNLFCVNCNKWKCRCKR